MAVADVADRAAVERSVAAVRDGLGPVETLIAGAGVGEPTTFDPVNVADVEAMVRVNVLGVVYAVAAVLPDMLERKSGRVAAISSLAGFVGLPGESGYCALKAYINTYFDGLRVQLRRTGVSVTTVCPGFVDTPMSAKDPYPKPWMMRRRPGGGLRDVGGGEAEKGVPLPAADVVAGAGGRVAAGLALGQDGVNQRRRRLPTDRAASMARRVPA